MNLYKYGLVIGRFQMFHKGHEHIIRRALDLCDKVVVYIGSSQECGTSKNPFSYFVREGMITEVFQSEILLKRLLIRPLPDIHIGNNTSWGAYVLSKFKYEFYELPNLYITGCEKERSSWFSDELAPAMDELRISREKMNISATTCRELMEKDLEEEWRKLVPSELYSHYTRYRDWLVKN